MIVALRVLLKRPIGNLLPVVCLVGLLGTAGAAATGSGQPRPQPTSTCKREVWILLDCSGSMYLPGGKYANVIQYQGAARNLLEVSTLVIDEAAGALGPDVALRVFCFYTSTHETRVAAGKSLFADLDSTADGRIDARDRPGGFAAENRTNLAGALETVIRELGKLPPDPNRAVGILLFTDGDADFQPPGEPGGGSEYALRSCRSQAAEFGEVLASRNALVRFVGLKPNLKDARRLAEDCLETQVPGRVRFLPLGGSVAGTIQKELSSILADLSRLDVRFVSLNRRTGQATAELGIANRWCGDIEVSRAGLSLAAAGSQQRMIWTDFAKRYAPGESQNSALQFALSGLPVGVYDAQAVLQDARGREVGRSSGAPTRLTEERVNWSIEGEQSGLSVTGRLALTATVATKTSARLAGYRLDVSDGRRIVVPVEAAVLDLLPPERGTSHQQASFEFHFDLPRELRGRNDLTVRVTPELTTARDVAVAAGSVRFRQDPELAAGPATDTLLYRAPVVEQSSEATEEHRESGPVWTMALRVVRNRAFAGEELVLDSNALALRDELGGRRPLAAAACVLADGAICHWTLTSPSLLEALPDAAIGAMDVAIELRSAAALITGQTQLHVVRSAPLTWTFVDLDVPPARRPGPATVQAVVTDPPEKIVPLRDGSLVGLRSPRGLVVAGPYYRASRVERVAEVAKGRLLSGSDVLPIYWLRPIGSLDPRITGRPHRIAFTCANPNPEAIPIDWGLEGLTMPGRFRSEPVAATHLTHVCKPGASGGTFTLTTQEEVALIRLKLAGGSARAGSLPTEVVVPTGDSRLRLVDGEVFLVAEKYFAWSQLLLLVFVAVCLALGGWLAARRLVKQASSARSKASGG